MAGAGESMVGFLGVPADRELLASDIAGLPEAGARPAQLISTHKHARLVAAGSVLTAVTLIGGAAMAIYGGERIIFGSGGPLAVVLAVIGIVLAATHWGWVHVAEYVGISIDERQEHGNRDRGDVWLATIQPYPRFTVMTGVLDDASTRIQRVLIKPVLTGHQTFTFVRETDAEVTFSADAPAEVISEKVETMRRQARLDTDRLREQWEAASAAYVAALFGAEDDQQRLAAQRAAAIALSEHINQSLLHPPLVE
jgi:hypothetical protein